MILKFKVDPQVYLLQKEPEGSPFFVDADDVICIIVNSNNTTFNLNFDDGICSLYCSENDFSIEYEK